MEAIDNWRKSRYSGNGGNCVEVADHDNRVLVRDTKNRASVVLRFSPGAWRRFAEQVKRSLAGLGPGLKGASSCLEGGAPRSALSYRPYSGHRLEEMSVGLMAYLDL